MRSFIPIAIHCNGNEWVSEINSKRGNGGWSSRPGLPLGGRIAPAGGAGALRLVHGALKRP
jgi:hypothetical protein